MKYLKKGEGENEIEIKEEGISGTFRLITYLYLF